MANQRLNIDIVAKDRTREALGKVQTNLQKVKQSVFNLRNAFISLGAGLVLRGFVNAGIQIEALEVQLKALFGSAVEGQKALESVTKFASKTPFELRNIQQGITALATVRKQAEDAGVSFDELLKITGNTATLLGNDFALASLQIQRSFSAGISSAELFRERGIKAMAGFKEGVAINSKESIKGLAKAFGTGGEFGKLMDELALTLFGTISNLKDAFFIFQVEVSKGFFGALKQNLGDLKTTVETNRQEIKEFAQIIGTGLSKVIQATVKIIKFFKDNIKLVTEAFKIFLALKLVGFFHNLAVAIGIANGAMLGFNATVRKNILIAGGIGIISQLDLIIRKFKEMRGISDKDIDLKPDTDVGTTITKQIPKSTFMDKLILQGKVFKTMITDLNATALEEMKKKFFTIGEIVANSINKGIKKVSRSLAESVILGKDLAETFRNMAQQLLVNILAHFIELTARLLIDIALQKSKLATMKRQEDSLKKQIQLQGILMAMGGNPLGFLFAFGARASGGAVQKGKPYLVGERGAEMFIPNQTGQITQSARGTGGEGINVNFNINTVDASGFEDLLFRSRGAISSLINQAVNEQGRGSVV